MLMVYNPPKQSQSRTIAACVSYFDLSWNLFVLSLILTAHTHDCLGLKSSSEIQFIASKTAHFFIEPIKRSMFASAVQREQHVHSDLTLFLVPVPITGKE